MAELTVNGTELSQVAWNVVSRGGRWKVAGRLGDNPRLPGVHGSLFIPGKTYDENTLLLTMYAVGSNADGTFPASPSRKQLCRDNIEALMTLFTQPNLLSLKQYADDGTTYREALCEVTQAIDFSTMAGGTRAEFAVELRVPGVFWFDGVAINQTLNITSTNQTLTFTSFNGSAPLVNANFELTAGTTQAVSPRLTDPVTGQWVQVSPTLSTGQKWVVDSAAWTSTIAGSNVLQSTTHGLGATFLDLTQRSAGVQVQVQNANTGTLKITAKRAWLLA